MTETNFSKSKSGNEVSLKELIIQINSLKNYFLSKKKQIALISIIGGLLGLGLSFIIKPKYVATTTFVLEDSKKSGLGEYASIAAKMGISAPSGGGGIFQDDDNIMSFIKSRRMISRTFFSKAEFENKEQLLIERYIEFNGYKEAWQNNSRLSTFDFSMDKLGKSLIQDSLIAVFYKNILESSLVVDKPDKDEDIIVLSFTSKDELFSKAFNENLLKNVTEFYTEIQTKRSTANVDILQYQVDSVRFLLNNALSGVAYTTEANPNPNPAFQRLKVPSQRKMIDVEMNKAILEELVKQLEIARINLRRETPLIQVIDNPVLPLEKIKLGKFKGLVVGGFLGFLISFIYISFQFYFVKLMK